MINQKILWTTGGFVARTKGAVAKLPREHVQDAVIATLRATIAALKKENKALKAALKAK
jgi:hypothetical protein